MKTTGDYFNHYNFGMFNKTEETALRGGFKRTMYDLYKKKRTTYGKYRKVS